MITDKSFEVSVRHLNKKILTFCIYSTLLPFGCRPSSSNKDKEPELTVVDPSAQRGASFKILPVTFPADVAGRFTTMDEAAFSGGNLAGDIWTHERPLNIDVAVEERVAITENVFLSGPGFLFELFPSGTSATIELSSAKGTESVKRTSNEDGKVAISLFAFRAIFPPAYRERYELKVSAKTSGTDVKSFSYAYSFSVRLVSGKLTFAEVVDVSKPKSFFLGEENKGFILAKIRASEACSDCLIEVRDIKPFGRVKYFVETPSLPDASLDLGITWPRRYAGLLIKEFDVAVVGNVAGNSSSSATVTIDVPAQSTLVAPWCAKKSLSEAAAKCPIITGGASALTYFGFVNVVPSRLSEQLLGGSSGIARFTGGVEATVVVKRAGAEVEKKTITVDSGAISPLDSLVLPPSSLEIIKNALLSGAPEFAIPE